MDTEKQLKKEWRSLYKLVKEAVALDYFSQATQGDANAQLHLGKMYFCARGEKNHMRAFKYFTQAAQQGNAEAIHMQGSVLYDYGRSRPESMKFVLQFFTRSAELGCPEGAFKAGLMHYYGEGTKQDFEQAFKYFTQAAQQGHAGALYRQGVMYYHGWSIPESMESAFNCYLQAAEQGHEGAIILIASMYHHGEGVEKDLKKCLRYYAKLDDEALKGIFD